MANLPDKLYYRTGEIANAFNVNPSLIRYWEREFSFILKPKKNAKGERLYSKKELEQFRLIYHLVKEKGFTLEGAKKTIKASRQKINKNLSIIDRLEYVKTELKKIRENL